MRGLGFIGFRGLGLTGFRVWGLRFHSLGPQSLGPFISVEQVRAHFGGAVVRILEFLHCWRNQPVDLPNCIAHVSAATGPASDHHSLKPRTR